MAKKNPAFFIIAISSLLVLLSVLVEAQFEGFPPLDQVPQPKPEWLTLVNSDSIPKAPVKKTAETCAPVDNFCDWSCTNCINSTVDYDRCPGEKIWGISYDDGPSQFTPAILDHLKEIGATATFFVIGSRITENPDILKRTVAEGHQIGIHTWSHPALTTLTNEQIIGELKWTEEIIKNVTGLTPKFMRPPFGDIDNRVRAIVSSLGYKAVIWDLDTNDWMTGDTPPDYDESWIVGNFTMWVNDPNVTESTTGHISLEHDLYQLAAKHAPEALDIVKGAGFTIETVATCVNEQPYLESTGNSTATDTPATSTDATGATSSASIDAATTSTAGSSVSGADQSMNVSPTTTPSSYSSSSSLSYSSSNFFVLAIVSIIFAFSPFHF